MIVADPPTPLRAVQPNAPPELESLVLRCLEKDPAKRTPNVAVLAQELAPFASPSDRLSVERVMRVLGQPATGSGTVQAPAGAWSPGTPRETTKSAWGETSGYAPKRRPTAAIVAGVAGTVAVLGAGAFLALRRPPPPSAGSGEGERAGVVATAANPLGAAKPSPLPPVADRPRADFEVEGAGVHPASPDAADATRPEAQGFPAGAPMTPAAPSPVRRLVGATPKVHPPVAAQPGAPADMFDDTK
jgi:hypothetical protein